MNLSNEDVNEILRLLDGLALDEFELTTERFHLELRRSSDGLWTRSTRVVAEAQVEGDEPRDAPSATPQREEAAESTDLGGLTAVRAPLLGTFYRAPRPGADPYVEIGDRVEPDTVVGIIETMKLMNSVHAGTAGTVVDIRIGNAEFAAKDAILLLIEPASP